jgi:putative two-component system response regulator
LRKDKKTADIRILVISGLEPTRALEESIIGGADDFLSKPIDTTELAVRVRSMLRVRNIHDEDRRTEEYIKSLQSLRSQ